LVLCFGTKIYNWHQKPYFETTPGLVGLSVVFNIFFRIFIVSKINFMKRFNQFPTDNSSSTNLQYDIVVGKLLASAKSHQKYNSTKSVIPIFTILVGIIQLSVALITIIFMVLKWLYRKI
jgi:hypothetical protein